VENWQAVLMVAGMFLLRLGVPVGITFAVAYWLRHLDAKWQAEALARRADELARQQPQAKREIEILKVIDPPCWVTNSCSETKLLNCPACQQPEIPCWLARFRTEGRLPAKCYGCRYFSPRRRTPALVPDKAGEL
jgi:hypothetical protein